MAGWAPLFAGPGMRANVRTTMHHASASVSVPLAAVDQLCLCDNYSQCICLNRFFVVVVVVFFLSPSHLLGPPHLDIAQRSLSLMGLGEGRYTYFDNLGGLSLSQHSSP